MLPLDGVSHPTERPTPPVAMSSTTADRNGPTTETEFDARLEALIRAAHDNGITIEGGWAVRTDADDESDWGIEIYEVDAGPPA